MPWMSAFIDYVSHSISVSQFQEYLGVKTLKFSHFWALQNKHLSKCADSKKTSLPWTISSWPSAKFLSASKKSTIIAFFRSQLKFLSSWSLHWAVILQERYILKLTMSLKSSYSWRVAELSRHRTRAAIKMLLRTYSLFRNKLLHKFLSAALRHRFKNTYLPKMGLFRSIYFLRKIWGDTDNFPHLKTPLPLPSGL